MTQEYGPVGALREELESLHDSARPRHALLARAAVGLSIVLLFGGLFWLGYVPKQAQREHLDAQASQRATRIPRVTLVRPTQLVEPRELTLPGSVLGREEVTIHARADGYLAELAVDIGDQVREGQLMATLDNPEIDREIQQARANIASSEAQLLRARAVHKHSLANLRRYQGLVPGLASEEEIDQKRTQTALDEADVGVAAAAREANLANLDRLRQHKGFSRVLAPFAGTVTARTVTRGALVSSAAPLFQLTSLDTVRIYVQLPQSRVAGVAPGQRARVAVTEYPGTKFEGRLTRTAGALDARTRTMNIEISIPNPEHKLLPGMYANVTLELERTSSALVVPSTALILGEKGVRVATVDGQGRVQLVRVEIARDRGVDVEIATGLTGSESIVANPGPALADGSLVRANPPS